MPDESTLICSADVLSDPGSHGFEVEHRGETLDGFVVLSGGLFYAYRNRCPHTGAPLDWVEHQFLDLDGSLIQCAVHDARFLIESGECVMGPCPGESLERLEIVVEGGNIYLAGVP